MSTSITCMEMSTVTQPSHIVAQVSHMEVQLQKLRDSYPKLKTKVLLCEDICIALSNELLSLLNSQALIASNVEFERD